MKPSAIYKKHKPYTLEEKKKLCAAWQKTKLSKSQFIKQNSLPSSFFEWCNTLLPSVVADNASISQLENNWLQVVQSNVQSAQCKNIPSFNAIELKLTCNAMVLNFCMPIDTLISFIKELGHATAVIRE